MVAAGLALSAPHAELTYSPGTDCWVPACGSAEAGHVHGKLAGNGPGIELSPVRKVRGHRPAGAAAGDAPGKARALTPMPAAPVQARQPASRRRAPVDVGYQTIRRWPAGFSALITITGRAALDSWRLAFRYPGVHIDSVTGARWVARDDGGVASAVPWPWGQPAGDQARFLIIANGTAGQPIACRFDGARCSFGAASDASRWQPASPG